MALISLQDISLAFGGPLLFDSLNVHVEEGERIALIGRNGAGKTTLMKIMAGELKPDAGQVVYQKGVRVTYLPQEVPQGLSGSVFDVVLSGLGERIQLIGDYHRVSHMLHTDHSETLLRRLAALQAEMDHTNAWQAHRDVEEAARTLSLDPEINFDGLSGGEKRRALLARAIAAKPDVLLLDEPTNHLDIESIGWLEEFLKGFEGTLFFVTHDRQFMQNVATRIMELDRGKVASWACDYRTFLERRQAMLENEEAERARFEKKLAAEEIWIRQGVKARRTRNEGRVKALERMREERRAQRRAEGKVRMTAQEADESGHIVAKVERMSYAWEDKPIVRDLTTRLMRGDKIGIIGPNGSGKTTLLRLLLGELRPDKGTVKTGTNLEIAYYDQLREQLDPERTVAENVAESGDTVAVNGKPKHVLGYLQEFLFSPERARTKVKVLSGGERNRLLLARLFTKPSNLLVMDEPTNDLDLETLELLEDLLVEYTGTLLLVSHDRAFLNNVVTSTMVLEGGGVIGEYAGGYDDWLRQRPSAPAPSVSVPRREPRDPKLPRPAETAPKKITANQLRELTELPAKIESLEAEEQKVYDKMSAADYYKKTPEERAAVEDELAAVKKELSKLYERWEYLERLREN